tara:strand:- start:708 stop:1037 length:330 start_codon:yes stop_codon:yes gene_type:complete
MNYIKIWNNQECKLTQGKSGHYFEDILYWIQAGDLLIDANGKNFKCSHAQQQSTKKFNWYVCVNELTKKNKTNQRKKSVVYARHTLTGEWTKSFKPFKSDVYPYPWSLD